MDLRATSILWRAHRPATPRDRFSGLPVVPAGGFIPRRFIPPAIHAPAIHPPTIHPPAIHPPVMSPVRPHPSLTRRSRRLFATTLTELNAIAALARIGDRSNPNAGYSTPAATGMPTTL